MKQRTSQIIYNYWNEVRQGRLAPRRFDIEPARISGILAETLILERIDGATYRFRLAGTRIGEQLCADFRGQNFLDLWSPAERERLATMLDRMVDHGAVGIIRIEAEGSRPGIAEFEAVLLPLVHTRNVIDRFLGTISCGRAPSWLGQEPPTRLTIVDTGIVWPEGRPHVIAEKLNETPALATYDGGGRIVRQDRRQFRVLDGGRSDGKGR